MNDMHITASVYINDERGLLSDYEKWLEELALIAEEIGAEVMGRLKEPFPEWRGSSRYSSTQAE